LLSHLGNACDHLLLFRQVAAHFVFQIAESTRQTEDALNSAFFNKSTSALDARSLASIVRFVVLTHLYGDTLACEHTSRVTTVCADDLVFGDHGNTGSATGRHSDISGRATHIILRVSSQLLDHSRCSHKLIHLDKSLSESVFVLTTFVGSILGQFANKHFFDVLADFAATMPIEHAEDSLAVWQFQLSNVCIFL